MSAPVEVLLQRQQAAHPLRLLVATLPLKRKRRRKKVGTAWPCFSMVLTSPLLEKEESDEDMGFGLFD